MNLIKNDNGPTLRHLTKDTWIANKHMKRWLLYINMELQIEMSYNHVPIKNGTNPNHWHHQMFVRMWRSRKSHLLLVGWRNGTITLGDFLRNLNVLLIHDPATALLGTYSNELKTYVHTKTCTQMYIAALFIITKTWKHPLVLQ